jgi:Rrf2 family protein
MIINTKIRYGLRTVIEIAMSDKPGGMYQKDIAVSQKISNKYLDSIISSLKVKGLIANTSGKRSGYILGKPKEEITLYDIYTAFEPISVVPCLSNPECCVNADRCKARKYWQNFKNDYEILLKSRTLIQIIEDEAYEIV